LNGWISPVWPAPAWVAAVVTTREGGASRGPYASLNLGFSTADDAGITAQNRASLAAGLSVTPRWLSQVHGTDVVNVAQCEDRAQADASVSRTTDFACAILVADCMPILLTDRDGTVVAAAHAGWRGLCHGVIESTVSAMAVEPQKLIAWLGPSIGPASFEVGDDVRDAFIARDKAAHRAFRAYPGRPGKWLCDLAALARMRLRALGVPAVYGGGFCTVADARFYSHRRDQGVSGRMAALIWLKTS
jgi:polyphenol oxidase